MTQTFGLDLVLRPAAHVWIAAALCLLLLLSLRRLAQGPAGLELAAIRQSPALATSLGIPVARRRRTVLAVTAGCVALAGAGQLLLLGLVEPTDVSPTVSLQLFVAVLIGGTARWWGPVLGVAVITALPHVADAFARSAGVDAERSRAVLTAALLLLVLALRRPGRSSAPAEGTPDPLSFKENRPGEAVLSARGVSVEFGGLRALDDVSVDLREGEVHALIGPNGSGKSTLLRVLAGELPGHVEVRGVASEGVLDRVRSGVARTPQETISLDLPAQRQVRIGATRPSYAVLRHLLATPSSRRPVGDVALDVTGLTHAADADPRTLPLGEQRTLQIARAVGTGASVLLLDEPAAGMTFDERERLTVVLRRLAAQGKAVLLVEHDLRLVASVADRVTVLDAGSVIATGTAAEVRADPAVRTAYLGSAT